jgi:hypothetical protein
MNRVSAGKKHASDLNMSMPVKREDVSTLIIDLSAWMSCLRLGALFNYLCKLPSLEFPPLNRTESG